MATETKCPNCKTTIVVKRGKSPTMKRGKQQRYLCKECGKTFIPDTGFWKMKNSEKIVTLAIDVYISNLSSRKMRNQLKRHFDLKISHISVLDWVRKYVLKVQRYVNTLEPSLSGDFYADETEINRSRKDKYNDIFWCSVDWGTRYINATLYSPSQQNMKDATEFMFRIKKSKSVPKYVQTDAAGFYPQAFKNAFYRNTGRRDEQPQHIVNNVSKTKKHNVRIETLFSKIKDRVYDFRGLKALWSAPILMAGIVLQHNYIEAHTTTDEIPCESANLELKTGENRWMGLIRMASA